MDTVQIEVNDFEEGERYSSEIKCVIPRNNHQKMNFDVRSPEYKNF